jgi:NADPH:quinone reductase-like Zn-dependent oxidoreductase
MQAFRLYGSSEHPSLQSVEVPVPKPAANEVRIQVHATAVTPDEFAWYPTWHTAEGAPRSGAVPGHEFSGLVEAVGAGLSDLQIGDAVYGLNSWFAEGAAAEYCLTTAAEIAPKPKTLSHVEAAAVPISGLTAWQALFDRGQLTPGQKVLIHGGAGGVGTFAIQLAAWKGAFVVTTVSEANTDFVRGLGANQVIDYRKAKFEEEVQDADLVVDLVGGDTFRRSFAAIKPGGKVVTVATSSESTDDPKAKAAFFIVEPNRQQLIDLAGLIDSGAIRTTINQVFPLEAATEAYFSTKKSRPGKTVLQVVA